MVDILEEIATQAQRSSPYWGVEPRDEAARALEQARAGGSARRVVEQLLVLADEELRLGREAEALELLEEARTAVAPLGVDLRARVELRTGVAYLRLAETRNCATNHNADACIVPIRGGGIHRDRLGAEKAREALLRYLALVPPRSVSSLQGMWLLNLAHMTLGELATVDPRYQLPVTAFGGEGDMPRLRNVAPELGVDSFNLSGAMVVDDFDGDADLDVFTTSFDPQESAKYIANLGPGDGDAPWRFEDRSEEAGLAGLTGGLNALQADYDNDGDLDVLVLRGAWLGEDGRHPNSLLRNDGSGRFEDVTFAAGLAEPFLPTQTAAWADVDLDGDLDLFVGNEHDARQSAPSQLFRNDGKGSFEDVASELGLRVEAFVKAAVWGDVDLDGDPDLFVSVLGGGNLLFRNDRGLGFAEIGATAGVRGPRQSFPAWFWDFDNDGALDLYVSSYRGDRGGVGLVAASALGFPGPWELAALYRGDGRGRFVDVAEAVGLGRLHLTMGSNYGDLDGNGFLDFYLGTGYPDYEAVVPNALYVNRDGRRFEDVTLSSGMGHLQKGHAVAFADFDGDGDLDVFEQMGGAYPGDSFADALFENPGARDDYVRLRLRGTRANRSAIGARVEVIVETARPGASPLRRSLFREVSSGGSFGGNPLELLIHLGPAGRAADVRVRWPSATGEESFGPLPAGERTVLVEGQGSIEPRSP